MPAAEEKSRSLFLGTDNLTKKKMGAVPRALGVAFYISAPVSTVLIETYLPRGIVDMYSTISKERLTALSTALCLPLKFRQRFCDLLCPMLLS